MKRYWELKTTKKFQVYPGWQCCHGKVLSSEKTEVDLTERVVLQGVVPGGSKASEDHHQPGNVNTQGTSPLVAGIRDSKEALPCRLSTYQINSDAEGQEDNTDIIR